MPDTEFCARGFSRLFQRRFQIFQFARPLRDNDFFAVRYGDSRGIVSAVFQKP